MQLHRIVELLRTELEAAHASVHAEGGWPPETQERVATIALRLLAAVEMYEAEYPPGTGTFSDVMRAWMHRTLTGDATMTATTGEPR